METIRKPLAALTPHPRNYNKHPDRQLALLTQLLDTHGQQKPVVLWRGGPDETGQDLPQDTILAGHGLVEAARRRGDQDIACAYYTGDRPTAFLVADNRSAQLADPDLEELAGLLRAAEAAGELLATGYQDDDLLELLAQLDTAPADGLTDPDDIPAPPEAAVTEPGDLWVLGAHRLLCGDAGAPAAIDRLLDGAPMHLVHTDPPYNVAVQPRSNNAIAAGVSTFGEGHTHKTTHTQDFDQARHGKRTPTSQRLRAKDRPLENDFVSEEAFDQLLRAWFGTIARVLLPGRAFYIWGGYANTKNYRLALEDCGLFFHQSLIWVKGHPVLGRKDFMSDHEWCFYGWREGAAHQFFGPNNITDVWAVKKVPSQQMVHLTEKPVELAARALEYSTRPREHVLDLFGGSGSTLIAAEQLDRRAFLTELDPLYTDVIVQRWQAFTGREATLAASGESFAAVQASRAASRSSMA